jgi:tetratricopeptide (TPR) repeat protein
MTHQHEEYSASNEWNQQTVYQHLAVFLPLLLIFSLLVVTPSQQASAHILGLIPQTTQRPRDAGSGGSDEKDIRVLELGGRIKRGLAGEQQHLYQIRLGVDQFLKVVVKQQGIDLTVQMAGPDGKQIMGGDYENDPRGQEIVSLVTEAAGDYQLIVRPAQKGGGAGGYEIWIEECRAATENDRALEEARRLYEEHLELCRTAKYDEALPLVERALEIRRRILGSEHLDVAAALYGLAIVYWYKSGYAKAELLHEQALSIREKILGPDHPAVATSLKGLANIYFGRAEYARAESLYRRILAIGERTVGPNHPNVSDYLHNLATLLHFTSRFAETAFSWKT